MSRMSGLATAAVGDGVVYSYRPSLLGAAWQFKLADDGIDWVAGRRSGCIPFRDVRRVRMSFRPANLQSQRFLTEIWAAGAPKLEIVSSLGAPAAHISVRKRCDCKLAGRNDMRTRRTSRNGMHPDRRPATQSIPSSASLNCQAA